MGIGGVASKAVSELPEYRSTIVAMRDMFASRGFVMSVASCNNVLKAIDKRLNDSVVTSRYKTNMLPNDKNGDVVGSVCPGCGVKSTALERLRRFCGACLSRWSASGELLSDGGEV